MHGPFYPWIGGWLDPVEKGKLLAAAGCVICVDHSVVWSLVTELPRLFGRNEPYKFLM